MGTQKQNPYPHGNFAETNDFLEELVLVASGEKGMVAIPETENGYEDLQVNESEVKSLTLPDNAIAAIITIEADSTATNKCMSLRIKENGADPGANSGIAIGDSDIIEVAGRDSLESFRAIGIEAGKTHSLRIQYYKSNQRSND